MFGYDVQTGLALLITWVLNAVILMIIDRLRIGLRVRSFAYALMAAAVIAILSAAAQYVLAAADITLPASGLIGFIVATLVSAAVLWLAAKITPGFQLRGFGAAILAALTMAALQWLVQWLRIQVL